MSKFSKPSWFALISTFFLSVTILFAALAQIHLHREHTSTLHTLEEAASRIKSSKENWTIVASREDGNVSNGFYIVFSATAVADVRGLPRYRTHRHLWKGVVAVGYGHHADHTDDTTELGTHIGAFFLFGDQDHFSQIKEILE